jgi:hypothetical protein
MSLVRPQARPPMGEIKEVGNTIKFNIVNLVEAPPDIINAAQTAISMVWKKNVGEPADVLLFFAERIVDETGQDTGWSSACSANSKKIQFALDTMRERLKFGMGDFVTMLMAAAHEAMHMVQIHRGDPPQPSPKGNTMNKHYRNDRHEIEAWEEAMHVIKKLYPQASGAPEINGRLYEVPKVSKYL